MLADARKLIGERLVAGTQVSVRLDKGRPPLVKNPASQRLAETAQVLYSRIGKRIEPVAMRFGTDAGYAYQPGSDGPAVLETLAWSAPACTARRNTSNCPASPRACT
ncbi:glutamate carboxypeptidase [Pseudomonas aeruginosa]|nr:glutamate carboxypeptidase [Pseudomonas aeruginosa]